MSTQLQILNKVQRRLRETQTSSVATSEYSILLADFINEAIEDMNVAHDWSQLEAEISVTLASGTTTYSVTGTTNDSQLVFTGDNCPIAFMFDDGSDTTGNQMIYVNARAFASLVSGDSASASNDPQYFTLRQQNDADELEIVFWPEPSATRTVKLRFWTPQAELAVDGTDDTTIVYLPERPIVLGALYLALNERGEEIGEPGNVAETRFLSALSDAVYSDMINRGRTNALEFWRD